ncbi:FdhF/YdeP family oxidoreductase [Terrihabitans sp. B22-R8]|uniref:FdhF/YdeP family oxidoreductase n=1 Tax=Terrihabitans sp. B22-R8 TaxID=3425128 RepID=UPI00403D1AFB
MSSKIDTTPYQGPAGGWGSLKSVSEIIAREGTAEAAALLVKQNKPDGFQCISCAWAKPEEPHPAEFCENGAKATIWDLTPKTVGPDFFAEHTVTELQQWPDHDLEAQGRLTHPLKYDSASDQYRPITWDAAYREIGENLRRQNPREVVCYASGRPALEQSYMYALFARMLGTNNLPDSSNMCHETTSVAVPESIGVPVGTVLLDDFEKTDCILSFGQNVGTNAPRMLHQLQEARQRGCEVLVFNPLRERGWERFTNPQSPVEMATGQETQIATQYHQVKAGGDIAALMGIAKYLVEWDDDARKAGGLPVLDHAFIAEHTHGFGELIDCVRDQDWERLERSSGLTREAMRHAAEVYARSKAAILVYGMGLTQHVRGGESIQMAINLLLLRGNIGRDGAGLCPVRGHSNVQGQRTVGITEKPELVPLDRLAEQYGFEPPRWEGLNTVDTCEAMIGGRVKAILSLGGNFLRAAPETELLERAWRKVDLSVQIATRLNRSQLVPARNSYILPCLGRIEVDEQESGAQSVSMEDSTTCIHGSRGFAKPAAEDLPSEVRIVAELAKAALDPNPKIDWDGWVADYSRIRDAIEETYPEPFKDFNDRLFQPGGFPRPLPARERKWETETGKANFILPESLTAEDIPQDPDILNLITLRSNDQFNTTIYGYSDRFRGVEGTRKVVFISPNDMERFGLKQDDMVTLETHAGDQVRREVGGLRVVPYNIPEGCIASYYPECNPLVPLWHHEKKSKTPAAKSVPVIIHREGHLAAAE